MGAINVCDDQDINACIEEVKSINEEANFEELPLDEPTLELKTLPSTLKYPLLDTQQENPMIILSQLDQEQEKRFIDVLR